MEDGCFDKGMGVMAAGLGADAENIPAAIAAGLEVDSGAGSIAEHAGNVPKTHAGDLKSIPAETKIRSREDLERWVEWARKKVDWVDPVVQWEDEVLGRYGEHGK